MNMGLFKISTKSVYKVILVTSAVLLIPLIAMQLTTEVSWQVGDFIVAAILLISFGYLFEVLVKNQKSRINKMIAGLIVLASLVFIWAQLAVGLV